MKFCPECGNDTKGSTKFCPECGIDLLQYLDKNIHKVTDEIIVNSSSGNSEITARELGNKLEDAVAKIYKDRGYEVLLRQKLSGRSGQRNEIDILAKQGQVVLAIECKNYSEGRKVGISHMRDFIAKLDDLDIH
ncbi:MAG: restriction endonuclease, partial [Thaumarchaeota archaeon]|nr:restriction endonuclease [Nitrososphaerota archaeon]